MASKQSPKKMRIDALLVEKGLAPTRTKAQSLVLSGCVYCGTEKIQKSSDMFLPNEEIIVKGKPHPYVGRGGVKLKAALDTFQVDVKGKVALDIGASTGGFTDCLLQEGARLVFALDVGYGQLDWKLRSDERVIVLDRVNFRYAEAGLFTETIEVVVADVSFISLDKIVPRILELFAMGEVFAPEIQFVALIKPQFEVGRENIGKGGIVKDDEARQQSVENIKRFCEERGFEVKGVIPSPLLGQEGNQEFLLAAILKKST